MIPSRLDRWLFDTGGLASYRWAVSITKDLNIPAVRRPLTRWGALRLLAYRARSRQGRPALRQLFRLPAPPLLRVQLRLRRGHVPGQAVWQLPRRHVRGAREDARAGADANSRSEGRGRVAARLTARSARLSSGERVWRCAVELCEVAGVELEGGRAGRVLNAGGPAGPDDDDHVQPLAEQPREHQPLWVRPMARGQTRNGGMPACQVGRAA